MSKSLATPSKLDERGIISITVTVVFILVITLIVLGFSQVTQRNGKLALDRQLSTQAQYAAEAGINDVMNKIAELVDSGQELPEQTSCNDGSKYTKNGGKVAGSDDTVKYTCLLVDPTPPDVKVTSLTDESVVLPLNSTSGTLNYFDLTWSRTEYPAAGASVANCPNPGQNIAPSGTSGWVSRCQFGILRVDLVPNKPDSVTDGFAAAKAAMTLYMYPGPSLGSPPQFAYTPSEVSSIYGTSATQGKYAVASCTADQCTARITGMNFSSAYFRAKSIYQDSPSFSIRRGGTATFSYSQVEIDVTGKAQDVLRRLKVSVPFRGGASEEATSLFSGYALESGGSICKRYNTSPVLGNTAADTTCN